MLDRIVGGKYSLEREIARGGMGAIWEAYDPQLRRRVAIKLMSPDHVASATSRTRFEQEALAVARLQHANVIQIHDYGIDTDGTPFIVMELLEGEDLESRLRRQGKLPLAAVARISSQAARALSAAHAAGIVHRDLKPANIFLVRGEADETVKILDFGVASLVAGLFEGGPLHTTRAGALLGTPHYMSPEQVRGSKSLDHRSDLWSLAVVAYRALTGQLPFVADSLGDLLVKICTDAFDPPSSLVQGLPADVDRFFDRALARDPAQRFASARDLAGALTALSDAASGSGATKILVVDDEPDVALLVKQRFRQQIRRGVYEFFFATDGESALEQLRRHPDLDIALSDINMPGMDGLTFLERAGEVNPLVKVIMVSAYSDMTNLRGAMNRGAFDFLVKPIDFVDLERTIEKTVKHVREVKKTVRSTEENAILRMFVGGGIADRLLPVLRAAGAATNEAVEAAVAFIDVHGFTEVTQREAPDTALRRLNAIFEIVVPEVTARGGVVDKYVGDAVMAVFRGEKHLERAIEACVSARAELRARADKGGDDSPYGHGLCVGIDAGTVIAGSLGSKALGRIDYTVLGDVVSTAARLQGMAGCDQILLGEGARGRVGAAFELRHVGERDLPGRGAGVGVYDVMGRSVEPAAGSETESTTMLLDTTHDSLDHPSPANGQGPLLSAGTRGMLD